MEVIDLLSDIEGEVSTQAVSNSSKNGSNNIGRQEYTTPQIDANVSRSKRSRNKKPTIGGNDLIVIDVDSPQKQTHSCTAKNPYKRQHIVESKIEKSKTTLPNNGTGESPGANARPIENPYAKKRKATKAKPKFRKAQVKDPPVERELQAGLVFGEDVDHIQHNNSHSNNGSSSSSLKQLSLGGKPSSKCKPPGDEEYDAENDDDGHLSSHSSASEYAQHQFTTRLAHNLPPILYHDPDFVAGSPATIDGSAKGSKNSDKTTNHNNNNNLSIAPPKCKCRPAKPCTLAYSSKMGPNHDRPFYCCQKGKRSNGCNYFSWAFTSSLLHWYRFGSHSGHVLVKKANRGGGFRAEDLVQGKVGDCWFLSALAVVAERDDLIGRLIGETTTAANNNKSSDNYGMVEVRLFVDGYWKMIIIDDFLPCLIDQKSEKEEEDSIQLALRQSLNEAKINAEWGRATAESTRKSKKNRASSKFDPHSMADHCHHILNETHEFLHHDRFSKDPSYRSNPRSSFVGRCCLQPLHRQVSTSDLAYSKARHNQLWVPFVEKAYAKIHGSYRAISGGHVEEAFLDLTGSPTSVYNFDHHDFNPRRFWSDLMKFRSKRLPMGCGTSSSQGGIIGMHAYSILDVREVRNVGIDFFRDKLTQGTLGNVSGFTELDGTVRLLRIRNPHGQGEWKGEFSDRSPVWERLMANKDANWNGSNGLVDLTAPSPQSPELKRTMVNDGTFWIDYDSFLMGFHNVDVVLAFQGNHAKSFGSSFPIKSSNHRCTRAFEINAVGRQPGEEGSYNEKVEVYVMCIQKTRRGASLGRADRKKSYKVCDTGILVGECLNTTEDGRVELGSVDGRFFGLNRNGHVRIVLDRNSDKKFIVMPVSFGHPSAADEDRSFVVRFVADAPLLVQELSNPPKLNVAMQKFCFGEKVMALRNVGTSQHRGTQGTETVLMKCMANRSLLFKIVRVDYLAGGGGTVLLYLIVNVKSLSQMDPSRRSEAISFSVEINCRGMVCRTTHGLANHEVISKGKKFEAAWRRFSLSFSGENKSRLLAAVVQAGQDYQFGSIKCSSRASGKDDFGPMSKYMNVCTRVNPVTSNDKARFSNYEDFGIYASVETPSNVLVHECIDISPIQNKRNLHEKHTTPIEIFSGPSEVSGIDQDLDAAIMASITESQGCSTGEEYHIEAQGSFSEDIEQAIVMSLKEK